MGLRLYAGIAFCLIMVISHGGLEASRTEETEGVAALRESFWGGFKGFPELQEIRDLQDQGNIKQAHKKATEFIERPSDSFSSAKNERVVKASALYLRALLAVKLRDNASSIADMEKAASLGHPLAPYQAAARMLILWKWKTESGGSPLQPGLMEKVLAYYQMGAELADPDCISGLGALFIDKGQIKQGLYWFLLEEMTQNAEAIREYEHSYMHDLDDAARTIFDQVMWECSLSGGAFASTIPRLPGRSTLTAAYVDLRMRRGLRWQWSSFFEEDKPVSKNGLDDVFKFLRHDIRKNNPFVDLWLLINRRYAASSDAIVLESNQLMDNVLPGDQIVVRSGRLVHHSKIWAIDQTKQEVLLEDPFYEFWQPTHNRCVTVFERQPYKYERYLIRISLPELRRMLVAVMTVRDRVHQSAP